MPFNMRRVRLTALAEFDLVEAQDFYAPNGAWVLDHFMVRFVGAASETRRGPCESKMAS